MESVKATYRQLLDLKAGAERLDLSVSTIRRMISRGDLIAYRVGPKLLKLDADELDRVACRIPSAGDAA
jgi:excisionase family DNA binding protein